MPEKYSPGTEEFKAKETKPKKTTRRNFLAMAGTVGAIAAGRKMFEGTLADETLKPNAPAVLEKPQPLGQKVPIVDGRKQPEAVQPPAGAPGAEKVVKGNFYKTGGLAKENLGNLNGLYTGINGVVPEGEVEVDFNSQLEQMWDKKVELSGNKPEVEALAGAIKQEYQASPKDQMTLGQYQTYIQTTVDEVKQSLDFSKVAEKDRLDQTKKELLEQICKSIDAKDLLAYSLTEIMPSHEGRLNLKMADFLLQSAGKRYLESIPSLNDKLLSFGPYQLTNIAVYSSLFRKGGVNKINDLLPPGKRIGNQLSQLRGEAHHKAAYMFLVENVSQLLRHLNAGELKVLAQKLGNKTDIVSYIAVAHHQPKKALQIARDWLSDKQPQAFVEYCHGDFKTYAQKTINNLQTLTA